MSMSFYSVAVFSFGYIGCVEAFHPLRYFGLGFWQQVQEGYVGLVYNNGALQAATLPPGLHFIPGAYLGTVLREFGVLEDIDCFGCDAPISVKSAEGTEWKVSVNVANQVAASDAVTVVAAQGFDYDKKIGRLLPSVLKEVFAPLTNLEIRKDRATELNEMVAKELLQQMQTNWPSVAKSISVNYVTIESIECKDTSLRKQWEAQVEEDAKRVTTQMKSKTEAAEHSRQQAAVEAQAARDRAETEARNERLLADARAEAARRNIQNQADIDAATAAAEAARITAEQQLVASSKKAELVEAKPGAAAHEERLRAVEAMHKNEKLTTVFLPSGTDGFGGAVGSLLQRLFAVGDSATPIGQECQTGSKP